MVKYGHKVRLFSKSGAEPSGCRAWSMLPSRSAVLDGELCYIGADGRAHFHRPMAEMRAKWPDESALLFMVFDLLHQDRADFRQRGADVS